MKKREGKGEEDIKYDENKRKEKRKRNDTKVIVNLRML